jgi:hypothetical protein
MLGPHNGENDMTTQQSSALLATTVSFFKNPFLLLGGGVVFIGAGIILLAPQINRGFQAFSAEREKNAAANGLAFRSWELCGLHGGKVMWSGRTMNSVYHNGVTCGFSGRNGVISLLKEYRGQPGVIFRMEDPALPLEQQR